MLNDIQSANSAFRVTLRTMKRLGYGLAIVMLAAITHAQSGRPAASMNAEKQALVIAEKKYKAASAAYAKAPKDANAKKGYIEATMSYGNTVLLSQALGPKEKYPKALNLYRAVLKVDPKHAEALGNKKMIEDIYRSMNRPIPK